MTEDLDLRLVYGKTANAMLQFIGCITKHEQHLGQIPAADSTWPLDAFRRSWLKYKPRDSHISRRDL
jgi:hypothetical protein